MVRVKALEYLFEVNDEMSLKFILLGLVTRGEIVRERAKQLLFEHIKYHSSVCFFKSLHIIDF